MTDELIVGRVHDERTVLHVLPDAEEAEIAHAALGDQAALDLTCECVEIIGFSQQLDDDIFHLYVCHVLIQITRTCLML